MSTTNPTPTPTPVPQRPAWRSTVRTVFQVLLGLSAGWGIVIQALGLNPDWKWVATSVVVTGAITHAMNQPIVEMFLQEYLPWLSAYGPSLGEHERQ